MTYPLTNFRYLVEIDGLTEARFSQVSGFGSQMEVLEYREGGLPAAVMKLPGRISYPDITLRWGVSDSEQTRFLYTWHQQAINGTVVRRNGSIVLLGENGMERLRYNFFLAWPSRFQHAALDGKGSDVAIDEMVLSCERLEPV
ncbi:phage tail protein [Actinoplanes italicus]|uniref:Phage tail-like protein n=1 Tax=Actinoplanes italicus TaxID=113567 RepID=A0A2T0K3T5_9ACTN|nr:phage tail protein [Actinoplanes italicus]PRX17290.1 phage tail-like protein [Actinoplanes italicus]GIE35153.1 phage tail protein [Actinoplanes italicus]